MWQTNSLLYKLVKVCVRNALEAIIQHDFKFSANCCLLNAFEASDSWRAFSLCLSVKQFSLRGKYEKNSIVARTRCNPLFRFCV